MSEFFTRLDESLGGLFGIFLFIGLVLWALYELGRLARGGTAGSTTGSEGRDEP